MVSGGQRGGNVSLLTGHSWRKGCYENLLAAFGCGWDANSIPRTEMAEVGRLLGEVNKLGTPAKTKK